MPDGPPAERWLLVFAPTEVRAETGDVLGMADAGRWMPAIETRDGWVRIAAGDDASPFQWIRLDDRVQIVVRERGPLAP